MSDAKPFATVCEFDENVWIVDSPNEHRSCDVYAVCGKDKAKAERIASVLNAAVACERREAAAEALDGMADLAAMDRRHLPTNDALRHAAAEAALGYMETELRTRAAALRKGDV